MLGGSINRLLLFALCSIFLKGMEKKHGDESKISKLSHDVEDNLIENGVDKQL